MKGLYTFLAALLLTTGAFAQQLLPGGGMNPREALPFGTTSLRAKYQQPASPAHKLTRIRCTTENLTYIFVWDKQNRLTDYRVERPDEDQGWLIVDYFRYNDQGQMVRIDGYQDFVDDETDRGLDQVNYVEITYDEKGRLETYTSYNNFHTDTYSKGGTYKWYYNDNDQVVKRELYLGTSTDVFEVIEYTYEEGRLVSEKGIMSDYNGKFFDSSGADYTYDAEGRLIETRFRDGNAESGGLFYNGKNQWIYDENGNCIKEIRYDKLNGEKQRSEFEYGEYLMSETALPTFILGGDRPFIFESKNAYHTEHFYSLDAVGVLTYLADFLYDYDTPEGVAEMPQLPFTVSVFPNPAQDAFSVRGLTGGETVRLLSANGAVVREVTAQPDGTSRLPLDGVVPGNYILQTRSYSTMVVVR